MWNVPFPYEDTQQIALALRDTGANIPVLTQYGTRGIYFPLFGNGQDDLLAFTWQLLHAYKIGSTIFPHVHWIASGGSSGNVAWQINYQWVAINGAFAVGSVTPAAVIVPYASFSGVKDTHLVTNLASIVPDATPQGISSILAGKITRVDQGNDEFDGQVFLMSLDAHIQRDEPGSREEYVK